MPRPKKKGPTHRLNLMFTQPVRDRLDRLVEQTEADSMTEVIRRSLAIYESLVEAQANNEKVLLRPSNPDEPERELLLAYPPPSDPPPSP